MISPVFVILVLTGPCYIMEYNFQATAAPQAPYGAARFSGHFDRVQSQSGNGAGMIRGSYSFADPQYNLRAVDHSTDNKPTFANYKNTQGPSMSSSAAAAEHHAALTHLDLYDSIANPKDHGSYVFGTPESSISGKAKDAHLKLYAEIAGQHAAIGTQRETAN